MMLNNNILRKSTGVYKFTKSPEKEIYLLNMDDIKLSAKYR